MKTHKELYAEYLELYKQHEEMKKLELTRENIRKIGLLYDRLFHKYMEASAAWDGKPYSAGDPWKQRVYLVTEPNDEQT